MAAPAATVVALAGVMEPFASVPGVKVYDTVARLKAGVMVAFPDRVTVVEALVALAKDALAEGEADQPVKA
jgi:hypothetical protein